MSSRTSFDASPRPGNPHQVGSIQYQGSVEDEVSCGSYEYEVEYEEESCSSGSDDDILPTDIEQTKRALRRMSLQMSSIEIHLVRGSSNHSDDSEATLRRKTRGSLSSSKDFVNDTEDYPTCKIREIFPSQSVQSGDSWVQGGQSVAAAETGFEESAELSYAAQGCSDDDTIVEEEEFYEEEEVTEESIEEEVIEDEDYVFELNGTSYNDKRASWLSQNYSRLSSLEERSVETELSFSRIETAWGESSFATVKTNESSANDAGLQELAATAGSGDKFQLNVSDGVKDTNDDEQDDHDDDGGEMADGDDQDEDEPSPEDVKEAIVYILKQEKPIDKGYLSPQQATRMMALPFEDQKQILEHFELCDQAGDPICWDLLVAMTTSDDDDEQVDSDEEVDADACVGPCSHGLAVCLPCSSAEDNAEDRATRDDVPPAKDIPAISDEDEGEESSGSGECESFPSADDEGVGCDLVSLGSGYSLQADLTTCNSPVTYHESTENYDEEYIIEVIDELIPEHEHDEKVRSTHLKTMRQFKKLQKDHRRGSV
jgi:hypothetical protein